MITIMETNTEKYLTKNPVSRYLIHNFFAHARLLLSSIRYENAIDVGCGEGALLYNAREMFAGAYTVAVDVNAHDLATAKKNVDFVDCVNASIYKLPCADNRFDMVICTEVLEHLESPENAIVELRRVAKKYLLLSVPREPLWRVLNVLRGAYVNTMGNTTGHIQHWGKSGFSSFAGKYFYVREIRTPVPWIMLLCEKR